MMGTYIVDMAAVPGIELVPKDEVTEVLQNVRVILTTAKGTVPLDREFGIDSGIVDMPMQVAQAKLTNEIFQAIKRYEPRAVIDSISFSGGIDGRLVPKVKVKITLTR